MRAFLAACLAAAACAEVIDFNMELGPNFMVYRRVPMYGEDAAPAKGSPGDGTAHVTLDLEMTRVTSGGSAAPDAYVQVTVMTEEAFNNLGVEIDGEREFCCPNAGALDGKCPSTHALAVPDDAARQSAVALFLPAAEGAEPPTDGRFVSRAQTTIPLSHTGYYYIVFSSCTPAMDVVRVTGSTLWANPYGYMPANLYPLLPFYLTFTIAYLAAAAVWGLLCVAHRDSVMTVQTMITGVLVLGLLDAASRFYEFTDMNKTGTRSPSVFVFALVFRCAKRTLSRALVLMVALGYGVSKPTLGTDFFKIVGLSVLYLVAMVWSELIQAFVREDSIPPSEFLLLFVIANLDVVFYFWIFRAIVVTSTVLENTRQQHKLTMYTHFRNVMVAAVAASLAWAVYYMIAASTGSLDSMWRGQWMFDGFWEVLYFGILVAIAFLWRPTEHSLRYAYMQELAVRNNDDDDDEAGDAYLGDVAKEEEAIHAALDAELDGEDAKASKPGLGASSGAQYSDRDASGRGENARLATGFSESEEDDDDDMENV